MVIFDLDDTLYDYKKYNKIAESVLKKEAINILNISDKTFDVLFYQAKTDTKKQLGHVASSHNRLLYMQRFCELAGFNPLKYAMKLYNVYWESLLNNMELFHYVIPLFNRLRDKKVKIAVLTDLTAHIQYRKIERLGISEYIDFIVTSEEVGIEKPSEKMFEKIIDKSGFSSKEILMVGDNDEKDILGAEVSGIVGIKYANEAKFYRRMKEILSL